MDVTASSIAAPDDRRRRARRGLALFFGLVIVFEALALGLILATGNLLWIIGLMWSVALASVVARLVLREGFNDVSFRWGGRSTWSYVALGFGFPFVVGFVAWGAAWLSGVAEFAPRAQGMVASVVDGSSPTATFLVSLALSATVGTVINVLSATGEEIGWRGYMVPRMIDAGVPRPLLVSGVVWGCWHLPLIVAGLIYPEHPVVLLAAVVFVVAATSMNYLLSWVRFQTGSIWPAVVAHAAYNSIIQSTFMAATVGGAVWILGEVGIFVAVVILVAAVVVCRRPWAMLRTPDQPMDAVPDALDQEHVRHLAG